VVGTPGETGAAYAKDSSMPLPTRLSQDLAFCRFELVDEVVDVVVDVVVLETFDDEADGAMREVVARATAGVDDGI
jgi:hypothetical protein